jgi:anti-sigma factor RsiW
MTNMDMSEREEIEALLPWHAAGTLSRAEAARVEAALARDPELARRFELAREEQGETVHLNETLGAPSTRALDRLMTAIDAEPARRRLRFSLAEKFAEFVGSLSPRTLAWSGAAAALAIVLQAAIITGIVVNDRAATYQSASAPAAATGTFAAIRFRDQVTASEIMQFLTEHKLTLAGGPLAGGMVRVKLSDAGLPQDELTRVIKRLQNDRRVDMIATTQ